MVNERSAHSPLNLLSCLCIRKPFSRLFSHSPMLLNLLSAVQDQSPFPSPCWRTFHKETPYTPRNAANAFPHSRSLPDRDSPQNGCFMALQPRQCTASFLSHVVQSTPHLDEHILYSFLCLKAVPSFSLSRHCSLAPRTEYGTR